MEKRTVAVYGGSFNPPHRGHFETLRIVAKEVMPDSVMMLFSQNRFKPASDYASVTHRMEMAKIIGSLYPDITPDYSDFEERIGESRTAYVLQSLRREYPDTHFIWVMGADNLAEFHTWDSSELIMTEFPVFVVNRTDFRDAALSSPTATKYAGLRTKPGLLKSSGKGWAFSEETPSDISSRRIREDIAGGMRTFGTDTDLIFPYITEHRLYGI